jgi:Ran GTPase-activating protein (RanGAP) involved in mRNA processing and transport
MFVTLLIGVILASRNTESRRFAPTGKVCGHAHQFFEVLDDVAPGAKPTLRTPLAVRANFGGCSIIGIYGGGDMLGDEGAAAIAQAMEAEDVVQKLMLSEAHIGPRGAAALARAVAGSATLEELWLGGNEMGDRGAKAFAKALRANRHLRELLLYSNGISDIGAASLAAALSGNDSLHRLWLGVNDITDTGAAAFVDVLGGEEPRNTMLRELTLTHNKLSRGGGATLEACGEARDGWYSGMWRYPSGTEFPGRRGRT